MNWRDVLLNRSVTGRVNRLLEYWLPPALIDRKIVARFFNLLQGFGFRYIDVREGPERFPAFSRRAFNGTPRQTRRVADLCRGRTLLDMGCGAGAFVDHMRARGWDARGHDPHFPAAPDAPHRVANPSDFPADTVTSFFVLEHIPRAAEALRAWRALARRRIIGIVPCQRYRAYGYDGHAHFFPDEYQLRLGLDLPDSTRVEKVDGDWVFYDDTGA